MKIGILTLPVAENYGGILQAIALYRYLHNNKHDVTLIYKDTKPVLWKSILRSILLKIPFHDFRGIKTNDNRKEWQKRKEFHKQFIQNEIYAISNVLTNTEELVKYAYNENFDAVIVGSDQVWRITSKNDKYYKNYFLDFINCLSTKKIAYAASFGKSERDILGDEEEISRLLQQFEAISTREYSGIEICRKNFKYSAVSHVLDPTLLMRREFYLNLILKYNVQNTQIDGLLTYILDASEEKNDLVMNIAKDKKINKITHLKGFKNTDIIYSIPEWLAHFASADFIITDSFHGMVFSIIFQKDFLVIGNIKRGLDRFNSFLSMLNLENRLILSESDLEKKLYLTPVEYKNVNEILDFKRKKSEDFLHKALYLAKCTDVRG